MFELSADISSRDRACFLWAQSVLQDSITEWKLLAGDASFRRYFRAQTQQASFVLMDAPPEKEQAMESFIMIARALWRLGLQVPEIHSEDLGQGFLCLSDLGDHLFSLNLKPATVDVVYQSALQALLRMQQCQAIPGYAIPPFDRGRYLMEMNLIEEWYVRHHLQRELTAAEKSCFNDVFERLIQNAESQRQLFVHRDYHSRNLLCLPNAQVGILDFQDAVIGPVTYDLMSLIRDCYVDWPIEQVNTWIESFRLNLMERHPGEFLDAADFRKHCDLMGLQRHLKCIGLFARLNVRDHKPGYMQYWPRLFRYVEQVCSQYPELQQFGAVMQSLK